MQRTRVVIAEDDLLIREGIARLLQRSPFAVVGLAGDAIELMHLVREHVPELVVLDIRMRRPQAVSATRRPSSQLACATRVFPWGGC
jgi:DNA-binding NarL/FixJ family response regulator